MIIKARQCWISSLKMFSRNANASIGALIRGQGGGWVLWSLLEPLQSKESTDMVVRHAGGKALQNWVVIPFCPWLPASFPIPPFNLQCCINVEEFHSSLKPTCIRASSLQSPALMAFCRDQRGRFNLLTANFSWFLCSHAQSDRGKV